MTPQQIVGIAIRLFSLWLALTSIGYFVSMPEALEAGGIFGKDGFAYAVGALYFLAAVLLWLFPMVVANQIVPRTKFENRINLQSLEAARVGCALIGLWLFAKALPKLIYFLFTLFVFSGQESAFRSFSSGMKLDLLFTSFEFGLSLFLMFRSAQFAGMVIRDRNTNEAG